MLHADWGVLGNTSSRTTSGTGDRRNAMLRKFVTRWKNYRQRFVPWVMLNLYKNERTLRQVPELSKDKLATDEEVTQSLLELFRVLHGTDLARHGETLSLSAHGAQTHFLRKAKETYGVCRLDAMFQSSGFCVERRPSTLPSAGTGVFVTRGSVPKGTTVAMYPGTVYQLYEPIFFQSIRNPFVFRCIDGVFIDGNDKGISKILYRSCSGRDQIGPFRLSDISWLTTNPENPLAVGQYVNNCSNECSANVSYQEYDVPHAFPLQLRQYLPNVNYSHEAQRPLRCVVLVSLRNISAGEELFSNYYTVLH